MNKRIRSFIKKRNISLEIQIDEHLYHTICLLEESHEVISNEIGKNIDRLESEPSWSILHDLYKRSYDNCCGALGCFLISQITSSEALCRTAIESSTNLHYVSLGDSMTKEIAYFKHYIANERKENKNWKESVKKSDYCTDDRKTHYESIRKKDIALDFYEDMLINSLSQDGIDYVASNGKWPNIFERFVKIEDAVTYRTVYMGLCSQAHSDAEDILNNLRTRVIDGIKGMEEANQTELYHFSLYMNLMIVRYHIYAASMYLARYNIPEEKLMSIIEKVMDNIGYVLEKGDKKIESILNQNKT